MMDILSIIADVLGILASIVAILGLLGNAYALYFNIKHFWNGAVRITYFSNEFKIIRFNKDSNKEEVIFQSSPRKEDYYIYREMGKIERREKIPPFLRWNIIHWTDDIRKPNYPLRLLIK